MHRTDNDRPAMAGRGFLVVYLLILGLLAYLFPPWRWNQSRLTEAVGALLFPFLGATAVYYTSLFVLAVTTHLPGRLRALGVLSVEFAAVLVALAALYTFPSLRKPTVCLSVIAAVLAGSLLRLVFRARHGS